MKDDTPTPVCSESLIFDPAKENDGTSAGEPPLEKDAPGGKKSETVMLIVGTRPEAIKMAPLLPALADGGLSPFLLTTGQHGRLLQKTMRSFAMHPDLRLSSRSRGTLAARAGDMTVRLARVFSRRAPRAVLVHGDTLSAYAAASAAFLVGIPIAHVEAGLRTYDTAAPYPEEFCRRAIDVAAAVLYAPTEYARENLLREGREDRDILVTGNTGLDALAYTVRADFRHPLLRRAEGHRLLLATLHRRETDTETLCALLRTLRRIADTFPDVFLLFPYHPNPAVARPVREILAHHTRIAAFPAPPPSVFHNLLARAYLVLTDSGGIQEEAAFLGRPTLVLREKTERGEGVAAGALSLVGTDPEAVFRATARVITRNAVHDAMAAAPNPFGDGAAAPRIAADLAARIRDGRI